MPDDYMGDSLSGWIAYVHVLCGEGPHTPEAGCGEAMNEFSELPRRKQRGIVTINNLFFAASGGEFTRSD